MRRQRDLELDLTPLIDVVFILLIFFIITSTFKKDELSLALNLPSSESGNKVRVEEKIDLELKENVIAFNGSILTLKEIATELLHVTDKSVPVYYRIDQDVRYEEIVKVLELLKKHRFENIVLITEAKSRLR